MSVFLYPTTGGSGGPVTAAALSANAVRTITGNGVTTFGAAGAELQGTIDTTGTVISTLAGMDILVFEPPAAAVVSANPACTWNVEVNTTPGTGTQIYFVFGFGYAASTAAFDPATSPSIWWALLMGPLSQPGTTGHFIIKKDNADPGTGSNLVTCWGASCALDNAGSKRMAGVGRALYFNNNWAAPAQDTVLFTPTSTDLIIPFCGFGHNVVGSTSEVLGVTARYFVGI